MAAIQRLASAVWRGELKTGSGAITATSGVLRDTPFSYATRFENARGTNPEELIAAAHAACFSMAFANYLSTQGHRPLQISTRATISLENGVILQGGPVQSLLQQLGNLDQRARGRAGTPKNG